MDWKDIKHWYVASAAAGLAITVAAVASKSTIPMLIGVGLLFIGIGQWINRKPVMVRVEAPPRFVGAKAREEMQWRFGWGLVFEVPGVILLCVSAYLIYVVATQL
jgi:hypothetical protein